MNPSMKELLHASLKVGKGYIADEKNWLKRHAAQDSAGKPVPANDASAVCFCSIGAVLRTNSSLHWLMYNALFEACQTIDPFARSVAFFNDSHTHAEVMKMWDLAIQSTQPKGQHA